MSPEQRENHSIFKALTSKRGRTSLHAFPRIQTSENESTFSISNFPPELRDEIYAHYFASLLPLSITPDNLTTALHNQTDLSLSSPYFKFDIRPALFYSNCTFSFSNPKVLRQLARGEGKHRVAKVRIEYGKLSRCHRTDWVFLLFQNFGNLKEVTFIFEVDGIDLDASFFGQWWKCVRDAMREASNSRVENISKRKKNGIMLKVESGNWSICEIVGGCQ
jgi:hypothetical protein